MTDISAVAKAWAYPAVWLLNRCNLATLCLLIICGCAIAEQFTHSAGLSTTVALAWLVFVVLQWQQISRTYKLFAILTPALAAILLLNGTVDAAVVSNGLDRAAFFTLFLTSLAVLRESAQTSSLVRRCGKILVNQPPARRYMLMAFGSHLFGIMLNIGALNVLGSMVQRATRGGADTQARHIAAVRRRRMLTATLRGFCGVPLWAPTSVTMLLVLSAIPQMRWEEYAPLGLVWTLLFILWGAVLDWLAYPRPKTAAVTTGNLRQLIPLVCLVALIPGTAYFISDMSGLALFPTLLMCAPVIGLIWIWQQYRGQPLSYKAGLLSRRLKRSFPRTFTNQRNEVVLFTTSGFIGVILIPLINPTAIGALLAQAGIGDAGIMTGFSLIMLACSFIGINAIISVTLMLGAIQKIPDLSIAPQVQASVVSITWAVFAGASPFTASLRFISGFSGTSPLHFGVIWNGWFSVSVLMIMYLTLYMVL
ncbi:hypothetical protein Q4485_03070 [Granulosicoccaceae sp. 1_MG-2023]|nr:hypothetical protein [Granulosicoccaceae sp. 1_MG-2023]